MRLSMIVQLLKMSTAQSFALLIEKNALGEMDSFMYLTSKKYLEKWVEADVKARVAFKQLGKQK